MGNKEITNFLDEYVQIPNPQYAVMLKGAWGCGKTFFIQQWIKTLKNADVEKDELNWKPIYISLFGLTEVQQVTESINKEIYPWLYSKGAKFIKNFLKAASKIALKYDIDADGNGKNEGSATFNLDSILLLKEDNSEIRGNKILIFDDFERCNINFETLLGYINYFSEHCKCKIIIIGDESKLSIKESESTKLKFSDFKEKTIGRTFEIKTNISEVVDFFINELTPNNRNLLLENKELIIQIFEASVSHNLRILRQCLNDYNRIVMALPEHYHESLQYHNVISSLLANFIAVYFEYKSGNTEIAEIFNRMTMLSNNNSETNKKREKILSKYRSARKNRRLGLFDDFIVEKIIYYLNNGSFNTEYLQYSLDIRDTEIKSWEHLYDYWRLSNEEYKKYYDETIAYYSGDKCDNLKDLFAIISIFSVLSHNQLLLVSADEIIEIGKKNIDRLMAKNNDLSDLVASQNMVDSGLRSHPDSQCNELLKNLLQYFNSVLQESKNRCPNRVSVMLENLDNESCKCLEDTLKIVVPLENMQYIDTPFFKFVDPQKVANRIMGLSNESKNTIYQFLLYRYDALINDMAEEMPNLELIGKALKEKAEQTELIEKFSLNQIISVIEEIVEQLKQE